MSKLAEIPAARITRDDVLVVHTADWQLDCRMLSASKTCSEVQKANPGQMMTVLRDDFCCLISLSVTCLATMQCSTNSGGQRLFSQRDGFVSVTGQSELVLGNTEYFVSCLGISVPRGLRSSERGWVGAPPTLIFQRCSSQD